MTAKKKITTKPANKTRKVEKMQVTLRNEHYTTIQIDVVDGDVDGALKKFVGTELMVEHSCRENDLNAEVLDNEMVEWSLASYTPLVPENVSAMEKGVTIEGPGDVVKEIVESLRETYDSSGTDMPKALHDLVFQLEVELGIVD